MANELGEMGLREKAERLRYMFDTLVKQKRKYDRLRTTRGLNLKESQQFSEISEKLKNFTERCKKFIKPRKNGFGKFSVDDYVNWYSRDLPNFGPSPRMTNPEIRPEAFSPPNIVNAPEMRNQSGFRSAMDWNYQAGKTYPTNEYYSSRVPPTDYNTPLDSYAFPEHMHPNTASHSGADANPSMSPYPGPGVPPYSGMNTGPSMNPYPSMSPHSGVPSHLNMPNMHANPNEYHPDRHTSEYSSDPLWNLNASGTSPVSPIFPSNFIRSPSSFVHSPFNYSSGFHPQSLNNPTPPISINTSNNLGIPSFTSPPLRPNPYADLDADQFSPTWSAIPSVISSIDSSSRSTPHHTISHHSPSFAHHSPSIDEPSSHSSPHFSPFGSLPKDVSDSIFAHLDTLLHWASYISCEMAKTRSNRFITLRDFQLAFSSITPSRCKRMQPPLNPTGLIAHSRILDQISDDKLAKDE